MHRWAQSFKFKSPFVACVRVARILALCAASTIAGTLLASCDAQQSSVRSSASSSSAPASPGMESGTAAGHNDPSKKSSPVAAAPSLKTIDSWCVPLVARLPKISLRDCRNSKVLPTGARSFKGMPILARDFAAPPQHPNALRVLLIGGIHGDELTASAIVFKWLDNLQKTGAREFAWKVAPIVNPDGLLAPKPQRMNARGVDLNRNFPTPNWEQDAPHYWIKTTGKDPRRFPGKAPISEPESRWVFDTIEQFKPDVVISVHAPFGVLDFDGPVTPPIRFGRLMFNRVGVYPGSLGNYSGLHKDIPVVTIELPNATQMPPDAEVQRIWQDMLNWIRRNVPAQDKMAINP